MTVSSEPASEAAAAIPFKPITLSWALRRTAMAIVILAVSIGTMAWLIHASIDQDLERVGTVTATNRL